MRASAVPSHSGRLRHRAESAPPPHIQATASGSPPGMADSALPSHIRAPTESGLRRSAALYSAIASGSRPGKARQCVCEMVKVRILHDRGQSAEAAWYSLQSLPIVRRAGGAARSPGYGELRASGSNPSAARYSAIASGSRQASAPIAFGQVTCLRYRRDPVSDPQCAPGIQPIASGSRPGMARARLPAVYSAHPP